MDILSEICGIVTDGSIRLVDEAIDRALQQGLTADEIISRALLPGLVKVGQRYRDSDDLIPELLCASRCMTIGLEKLQPYLRTDVAWGRHKVIIGTVAGDLHDIGKNLVSIMLGCAGIEVIDLGVDVSAREFVRAVTEHPEVRVVCLSCLLTTSMERMRETVQKLRAVRSPRELTIMVGGAPISQTFAERIGADSYTEDAVSAVDRVKGFLFADSEGRAT